MKKWLLGATILIVLAIAVTLRTGQVPAGQMKPTDGFTLHIDAKMHFPGKPDMIAHHWCKAVAGGLTECQLYDSDGPDARLVGVEVIVPGFTYESFPAAEKGLWHYHRTEIPKVSATLPGLSTEEANKIVQSLLETYGKIYLLWDPSRSQLPIGNPSVTVLPK